MSALPPYGRLILLCIQLNNKLMNLGDNHFFDPLGVTCICNDHLVEVPFLLCRLLGENVAVVSVSSLHFSSSVLFTFPVPVSTKRFLAPELVFILGIVTINLVKLLKTLQNGYFFFTGAIIIIILFPSNLGICSALPYSSSSRAKRSRSFSPCSEKRIERPRKNT